MKSEHDHDLSQSVDLLNSLVRGEIAAVETYDQAIEKYGDPLIPELRENRNCHHDRIAVLSARVRALGGTPSTSSGAWGVVAGVAQGGAKLLGKQAAISNLESGEDHGLEEYREAIDKLDPGSASILLNDLLPAQERTHTRMSMLKKSGQSD